MIDKITLSLMLFFNTLTSSIDPSLSNERKSYNQIKKEIKSLERKIEWVEATDENYASRAVKTKEITDEITNLNGKIVKIEKVANLKDKCAKEDSLTKSKNGVDKSLARSICHCIVSSPNVSPSLLIDVQFLISLGFLANIVP